MLSIFISHDWNESRLYEGLIALLDNQLGPKAWINVSIPQNEAIKLRGYDASDTEHSLDRLEDEIIRVQAALSRPGLPDCVSRVVWDEKGNRREEECVGSLRMELDRLMRIRANVSRLSAEPPYETPREFADPKGAASQIRLHPELSLAIRNRICQANIVFVLVTPYCRFRRWVDFEISVSATTPAKVIAVMAGGYATRDFYIDCRTVVPLDPEAIRRSLDAALPALSDRPNS